MKVNQANHVFVTGMHFRVILLCTEKATSTDDAFTNTVIQQLEHGYEMVAEWLQIQKICYHQKLQAKDIAISQSNTYPSIWWISIGTKENKTIDHQHKLADNFICLLNEMNWQYPQQFIFGGDGTQGMNDEISNTLDMYLLNTDIARLLVRYVFEDLEDFLQD